jgi:hypothetical protein
MDTEHDGDRANRRFMVGNTIIGLLASCPQGPDAESVPSRILATAAVGIVLIAAGACGPVDGSPATAGTAATTGTLPRAEALQQLETLAVGEWASMSGYSRDRFDHWSTQTDGCDTRDEVLRRDGTAVTVTADCKIVEGTWFSVYDGETFSDPQSVDIDHMVPLANAWRTGASAWSDEQREQFANDLERPQLHAVGRSVNRSKGDQDPSQWRPPRATYWCAYAQDWVAVKAYWQLSVTADEKAALTEMLDTCP